ncbi:DUF6273 domain-containing protein [Paratractidigestivibacter sp.]|uniref:DUF6273 domain-containing protein n=1 Tax=Paratractidigestivibacter sp. TaxID=2847316 RepID=UPI002AC98398|nr:DUF6273 domain-containing protein [Paratractidigestivibacter sp.]
MARRASVGGVLLVVFSLAFVAVCGGVFYLVFTGRMPGMRQSSGGSSTAEQAQVASQTEVEPKDFSLYTWEELGRIATMIESAGTQETGLAVAQKYGIVSFDGSLADCAHQVVLADGSAALCRVVGVLADDLADGSGKAGLTFMVSGLGSAPMNSTATCDGGWEGSELRGWLNSDGSSLLPDDLRAAIKSVSKLSNNTGITSDTASVTSTSDGLWLFSASEIYGSITWYEQEYGDGVIYNTDYTDFAPYTQMINSEGLQYLYFSQNDVADRSEYAAVAGALGKLTSNFWLRTAYPLSITGSDDGQFYQVMASGYPSTVAVATQQNKILAGFCL